MGQAKQRGTFEQRKKEAELRNAKERMARALVETRKPTQRQSQINLLLAASIAMSAGSNFNE